MNCNNLGVPVPQSAMNYFYSQPEPQSAMALGYAQIQQYRQTFTSYNPYYMGYPWTFGQHSSMYPGMPMYHQTTYQKKVEEPDEPPVAKRACIESPYLPNHNKVNADLFPEISNLDLTQGTTLAEENAITAVTPPPPDSASEYKPAVFPIQQYSQDQPTKSQPFQASQVMLTDGTKSFLWDQQVPTAFAAYQQPVPCAAQGSSHRRRPPQGGKSKPYHCNLCNKSYETSYKLKLHMYVHPGERPFVCECCDRGFSTEPNLNAHRRASHRRVHNAQSRVHTNQKQFACKLCERGFSRSTDLIIHMVTHVCTRGDRHIRKTGPSRWACVSCETGSFESLDQAQRHSRQHETGKGLTCPVCNMNYHGTKAHVLVKHIKKCHPVYMESLKN